jgi:hypothetical protein
MSDPPVIPLPVAPEISDAEYPVPAELLEWEADNLPPPPEPPAAP